MYYNRIKLILFAIVIFMVGCKKENHFTISGKITELQVSTRIPISKVAIDNDGEFKFIGKTSIPTFYLLKLTDSNFITLLVDSVDHVTIQADAANFGKEYVIEGSLGSVQVKELTETLNRTQHQLDSLRSLFTLSQANPDIEELKVQWNTQFQNLIEEQNKYSVGFVLSNPFSMASVYALYQKYKDQTYVIRDLQTMRTAASALNAIYPNSAMVRALYENTVQILREQKTSDMRKFVEENGVNSPDIVLPDINNKKIALSSLKGKVILIQFWAAEDEGSRLLNPLLVDAYEKYKSRGFEIYQVNIGTNRSEWIDAIDKDKLKWINVGDLEGCKDARVSYNIQSIPSNYLLDRDGKIAAKNLTGPNLDKALANLLK